MLLSDSLIFLGNEISGVQNSVENAQRDKQEIFSVPGDESTQNLFRPKRMHTRRRRKIKARKGLCNFSYKTIKLYLLRLAINSLFLQL
jgi:hypothetical protein